MASLAEPFAKTASYFRSEVETGEQDDGLSAFVLVRQRLFGIAQQMLGCVTQAEDVVQDVWLRWQSTNRSAVANAPAFLAITTARLCINVTQSAHSRREISLGNWLLEPVDNGGDPEMVAERGEALRLAVHMLLEKLSPTERAAYVLREAFDYAYREIADVLHMEEANTRQLVSRARKHLAEDRRKAVSLDEQRRFLKAFVDAVREADMSVLEDLFSADLGSGSDRNGFLRDRSLSFCPQRSGEIGQALCA